MKWSETEVTKKVYFITSYVGMYKKVFEYEDEISKILFIHDKPLWAALHALGFAGGIVPIEYCSGYAVRHHFVTNIYDKEYDEKDPVVHYLEITAWESTWKRIEKLPWATVIEEAV